jgi:hypothetical protein
MHTARAIPNPLAQRAMRFMQPIPSTRQRPNTDDYSNLSGLSRFCANWGGGLFAAYFSRNARFNWSCSGLTR